MFTTLKNTLSNSSSSSSMDAVGVSSAFLSAKDVEGVDHYILHRNLKTNKNEPTIKTIVLHEECLT